MCDVAQTVKVLTIEPDTDLSAPELRRAAIETLEGGGLVYLPRSGFELSAREQELISDPTKVLTQVPDVEDGRPTIIYDPARGHIKKYHYAQVRGKMMRAKVRDTAQPDLEAAMARYGKWAENVIAQLFPSYQEVLERKRVDLSTFSPQQHSIAPHRLELRLSHTGARHAAYFLQHQSRPPPTHLAAWRTIRALRASLPAVCAPQQTLLGFLHTGSPRHR